MARLFNNNAANYMSRSASNFGLNGLTECSFGFWLNATSAPAVEGVILRKQATGGWGTMFATMRVSDAGKIAFQLENNPLAQAPSWVSPGSAPTGTWTRYLFAWQRNVGTSADATLYVNGQVVTPTFTADGYTTSFVLEEISDLLRYGGMPEWGDVSLNAALAWVCVWNRKLTAEEAAQDYIHPLAVRSGLIHAVALSPDTDGPGGFDMTVVGTLAAAVDPVGAFILQQDGHGSILLEDGSGELLLETPPLFFPECLQLPSYMGAM